MDRGIKTSEFAVLVSGMLTAVIPVVLDKIPPDSVWAVVLGSLLAAATYIAGRSYLKATDIKASAIRAAAEKVPQANP